MLPLLSLTFEVQQQQDLLLPHHAGSMLRGAFGTALRRLACITRQDNCKTCPLYRCCAYVQLFETPVPVSHQSNAPLQVVNPYVIKAPPMGKRLIGAGQTWHFGMTLMGAAIDQLPLVTYAWREACERGFGKHQNQAQLLAVYQANTRLYQHDQQFVMPRVEQVSVPVLGQQVQLCFSTPLRLQHEGHVILRAKQLSASLLLMALAKRVQRMADLHTPDAPQLDFAALKEASLQVGVDYHLTRDRLLRYSNRQNQSMDLQGLVGDIFLHGDLTPFAMLLALGEQIHVGKSATFGLGQYRLRSV